MTPDGNQEDHSPHLSRKKMVVQVIGFLIGIALLYVCIRTAWTKSGDWSAIREADSNTIIALIGFGLLSTIIDGFVFWGVLCPYKRLKPLQVQNVNMTAAMLNYAPIRLGTLFRITYHARVDNVKLLAIVGWFAAIVITTLACMTAVTTAALVTGGSMIPFSLLTALLILVFGGVIWLSARLEFVKKICKGKEKMLGDPKALFVGLFGRLLVLASNTVRMGFAAEILGIELGIQNLVILSVAALMLSFNPLGRVGWREWTLMMITPYLAGSAFEGTTVDVEGLAAQLALVESAGEFLAIVPFGILTAAWALPRLLNGRAKGLTSAHASGD